MAAACKSSAKWLQDKIRMMWREAYVHHTKSQGDGLPSKAQKSSHQLSCHDASEKPPLDATLTISD